MWAFLKIFPRYNAKIHPKKQRREQKPATNFLGTNKSFTVGQECVRTFQKLATSLHKWSGIAVNLPFFYHCLGQWNSLQADINTWVQSRQLRISQFQEKLVFNTQNPGSYRRGLQLHHDRLLYPSRLHPRPVRADWVLQLQKITRHYPTECFQHVYPSVPGKI